jgi:hypothetical protein
MEVLESSYIPRSVTARMSSTTTYVRIRIEIYHILRSTELWPGGSGRPAKQFIILDFLMVMYSQKEWTPFNQLTHTWYSFCTGAWVIDTMQRHIYLMGSGRELKCTLCLPVVKKATKRQPNSTSIPLLSALMTSL